MTKNKLEIKRLPECAADLPVDLSDPSKCPLTGLYRQTWAIGKEERSVLTYMPEGLHYNSPCLIIAPPSDADPAAFLEESGWAEFAERKQVFAVVLECGDGMDSSWNYDGKDADFMNNVYKRVQDREYYVVMQDCIYAFGFGDGAVIAQQAAMKMTSEWSGLATFGGFNEKVMLNAGDARDEDSGNQESEMYIAAKKCQLPVWLFLPEVNGLTEQVSGYWKRENHCQPEPLLDTSGTEIFMPENVKRTSKTNDDNIAQTRITKGFAAEKTDCGLLEYMWSYIGAARRHRGYGNKILRYYRDPIANGATYHTVTVDGITREWYEYVPEEVKGGGVNVPLVVVMHGRGGNGETFFDITDMSVVAEERKFIAVFPTADLYQVREDGLRNVRLWNGSYGDRKIDSLRFLRQMVEDVKTRNPVDTGRIYACGQSSGGYMTSYCAMAASDLFAAVSPWSGFSLPGGRGPFSYDRAGWFEAGNIPYCILVGEKDNFFDGKQLWPFAENTEGDGELAAFVKFLVGQFRLEEEPGIYCCHPVTYYVWKNNRGVPMLKVGIVKDMPHANYAEESRIAYDEFLSQFAKGEDGKLLYMGREAESGCYG